MDRRQITRYSSLLAVDTVTPIFQIKWLQHHDSVVRASFVRTGGTA